jgi:xanthine/uracil/vitamin C permease (AzgA family)
VPVHGLALLTIVLLATPWLAQVPRLSAAVALTLVGAQMFGRDTEVLWQHGYRPGARPARQCAVVGFWLVLAVSLAANNALVGFIAMAVVAGLVFQFRRWSRRRRRAIVPF